MRGYPLRSFSLRAEGVSSCLELVTGVGQRVPQDPWAKFTHANVLEAVEVSKMVSSHL